ncbi:kinase-like protein [Thelephora ganbajun]|uniref:Kinase-like protein n=1 Tax=Thelephora ganbajun TaxID=370292 RepID=A0ACB6ZDH4_THEGA|nr:kinase-like protein [Thelephora ganbajun]
MSDGTQASQSINVPPAAAIDLEIVHGPIEIPSAAGLAADPDKSPNRPSPPPLYAPYLKRVESLVEILSDERVYPAPGPSVPVDLGAPARRHSTNRSLLPGEVVPLIEAITINKDEASLTDCLCGDTAQTVVDVVYEVCPHLPSLLRPGLIIFIFFGSFTFDLFPYIDQVLGLPGLPPRFRRKCLSALCRICGRRALLPTSLQIPLCHNRSDVPRYRGGYADVWKGAYQGRSVAAKVLRVYSTSNLDKIRRRFYKEVMTWKILNHPNVLPLLGATIDNNQFVMVSEWMINGNINEFIKAHSDVNRFELLKDVARGLIYMHDQAMVHGDLKGANILIDPNGHARLADFGLLTIISDPTNPTASSSFAVGGTIRWMSPELLYPDLSGLKIARPTKQSDCYALGMVIYEVLTGRAPFTPFHHYVVIRRVIEGERPGRPGGPEGAWFTDDLWQTLNQCWAAEPKCRPSIRAVLECLERVSRIPEPPSQQVNGSVGIDGDDRDLARGSPGTLSRFDPRCFFAFLRRIMC